MGRVIRFMVEVVFEAILMIVVMVVLGILS